MKKNCGDTDRFIRALVGVAFVANIFVLKPSVFWTIILAIVGVAFIAVSYMGFCPLYLPFKICTIKGSRC